MERISIAEVKKRYEIGYRFVFSLEHQDRSSEMYDYVMEDYRIFDNIHIVQNQGCILFTNQYGERFAIDGITSIVVRSESPDMSVLDIGCELVRFGRRVWTFFIEKVK